MNDKLRSLNEGDLVQISGGMYNGPVFVYLMKDGDTLDSVAGRYKTTAKLLAELNNITNTAASPMVGKKIYVPSPF